MFALAINAAGCFISSLLNNKQTEIDYKYNQQTLLQQQLISYNLTNLNKLNLKHTNWICKYCSSINNTIKNCRNCGAPNLVK